jgi:ubiquinone/menaquinone biosynthesis C-methylase UbiE
MGIDYNYEEAVEKLRNDPAYDEFIKQCYLDRDVVAAAKRFSASDEFSEVTRLLSLKIATTPRKILDLGCGNGVTSFAFASLDHKVFAVDPNPTEGVGLGAIARLNPELGQNKIRHLLAFGEFLPFPDQTFDIIYTRQVLHHFKNLQESLNECYRVLKPGGYLLVTRDPVVNDAQQLEQFLQSHVLHQLHGGENAYTLQTYITDIKRAGFKLKKVFGTYDNVINLFPLTKPELKKIIARTIHKKIPFIPVEFFLGWPMVDPAIRRALTRIKRYPGRLYSFLGVKRA